MIMSTAKTMMTILVLGEAGFTDVGDLALGKNADLRHWMSDLVRL